MFSGGMQNESSELHKLHNFEVIQSNHQFVNHCFPLFFSRVFCQKHIHIFLPSLFGLIPYEGDSVNSFPPLPGYPFHYTPLGDYIHLLFENSGLYNEQRIRPSFDGGGEMLDFSPLWETLKKQGKSQYVLIDNGIDKRTMDQLRHNRNITAITLEKICRILDCTPNDVLAFTDEL